MTQFWQTFFLIFEVFVLIAYLSVLLQVIGDLFRDSETKPVVKVLWIVALVVIPLLTALVYILVKGKAMNHRQKQAFETHEQNRREYIRQVAATGPAQEIEAAQRLLAAGTIDQAEFDALKKSALHNAA